MANRKNDYYDYDGNLTKEERRKRRLKKRRRQVLLMRIAFAAVILLIITLAVILIAYTSRKGIGPFARSSGKKPAVSGTSDAGQDGTVTAENDEGTGDEGMIADAQAPDSGEGDAKPQDAEGGEADAEGSGQEEAGGADADEALAKAATMAAGYDYDGAVNLLKQVTDYESDSRINTAISDYETAKAACVAVDVNTVPHIFYHSLVNDPDRAFNVATLGQFAVDGMNAWMTTVDEFDKITQQLYDNGYVYVRLRDLVVETQNEDGSVHFEPNTNLMLPPGKKAIVLSVDDLSYYHSYKPAGFPDKLVIDDNGLVKCQYADASGNVQIGDFDVVPRLNTFLREHPDGAYHGARGMIALTGYNGVFGYRTDTDYEAKQNLMEDQAAWLAEHPDFNRQKEIEEATVIANAIKEEGWEFASHTWGHLSVTGVDVDKLAVDNDKWVETVQNIVGPTDIIIFAHGNDIGDWQDYSPDNPKYAYYNRAGYHFYCNVDGSVPYWVQIRPGYVRQGRINMDGYMLYQAYTGQTDVINNMIDPQSVFDQRRPTPVVANGQG